jgi:hypothetical protein
MINKAKIDAYIKAYVKALPGKQAENLILWDDCLSNFQKTWDIEYLDFSSNFKRSFKSTISTRLWKRDNFYPIDVMEEFIAYEKEIMRSLFRDLLDESKSIDGRVQRFVFYCDQLLSEIKDKGKVYPDHYHGDYYIPSMYLSFRYPGQYWFYDISLLRTVLRKLDDKNIPPSDDLVRYYKILNLLSNLLSKDEDFNKWVVSFGLQLKYKGPSRMWAYDLMLYISHHEMMEYD